MRGGQAESMSYVFHRITNARAFSNVFTSARCTSR
jgi:hypothetical protein